MELTKVKKAKKILDVIVSFMYKYRYCLGIVLLIICVSLELNGSSIGCWNTYITLDDEDTGIIWGESRGIRSDE